MTTTFDKREEGFEKKFVHDEELRFKAVARRNKQFGAVGRRATSVKPVPMPRSTPRMSCWPNSSRPAIPKFCVKSRKDFAGQRLSPKSEIRRENARTARALALDAGHRRAADVTAFALARRLRAGETVFSSWCFLSIRDRGRNHRARRVYRRCARPAARALGYRRRLLPPSVACITPEQPRWCASRSATSRSSRARSISAPRRSSRR